MNGVTRPRAAWWCIGALSFVASAAAAATLPTTGELADLSLDQLANIEVTSVSKKGERLSEAPASIFVITGEEIRRAGATSLAEALRLAPNLQLSHGSPTGYTLPAGAIFTPSPNNRRAWTH